jgi:hypothetical protein
MPVTTARRISTSASVEHPARLTRWNTSSTERPSALAPAEQCCKDRVAKGFSAGAAGNEGRDPRSSETNETGEHAPSDESRQSKHHQERSHTSPEANPQGRLPLAQERFRRASACR